jgi:hypothetical protein
LLPACPAPVLFLILIHSLWPCFDIFATDCIFPDPRKPATCPDWSRVVTAEDHLVTCICLELGPRLFFSFLLFLSFTPHSSCPTLDTAGSTLITKAIPKEATHSSSSNSKATLQTRRQQVIRNNLAPRNTISRRQFLPPTIDGSWMVVEFDETSSRPISSVI